MQPPRSGARVVGLSSVIVLGTLLTAAERPWVEVKSAHFTVASDAGDGAARDIAWQFEQIRAVVQGLWPSMRVQMSRPVLVLAARNEASMKALAPRYWEEKGGVHPESVFVTGADRHYIALRADVHADDREGINPYIGSYWSYVALVLNSNAEHELPLWFSRGLSEVLSNTLVRPKEVQVGRVVPWHLQRLRSRARLPLRDLVTVDRDSQYYTEQLRLEVFDAENWAFVHYLMLGDAGAHREPFNRFTQLVRDGRDNATALHDVFGDLKALESGFATYLTRSIFQFERFNVDLSVKPEGFASRTMSAAESFTQRAAFHVATGRPVEARSLLDEATKADPQLAANHEIEGMLLDRDDKPEEARTAFTKAVDLGSTSYYAYYRLVTLIWSATPDRDTLVRIEKLLGQTVALNENFAPAYALLGEVKAQLDRGDEGLGLARRAVTLEPGQARHRFSVARVLWRLSRPADALEEARKGLTLADNDTERRDGQELVAFFEKNSAPLPK